MSTATKEPPPAKSAAKESARRPSPAPREKLPQSKNPWHRLWQVPLLLAGLALFGIGVRALYNVIRPIPFEMQAADVRSLIAAGQFGKAIEQINILADYFHEDRQQGILQELAGDTHYLAQKQEPAFVRENYQRIIDHYTRAVALGVAPNAIMNERWGEAALALSDPKTAIEKLEAAIADDPRIIKQYARELVSAYVAAGELAKAQRALTLLLEQAAHPLAAATQPTPSQHAEMVDTVSWALCKQMEIALALPRGEGANDPLAQAMNQATAALADMPERDPSARILTWLGRAHLEKGEIDQAQLALTQARGLFVGHNLDDGRAGLLLAKIAEARNDLPKAAELYQDVITAQAGTPLWPAARLGRAEVAVRANTPLNDSLLADYRFAVHAVSAEGLQESGTPPELLSRDSLHLALVTDYQHAVDQNHLEDALAFLDLQIAMGPTTPGSPASTASEDEAMAFRLATTKEARAKQLLAEAAGDPKIRTADEAAAQTLFAQAADQYLIHSKLTTMQDAISGDSLWKAAQLFDQAGLAQRSIDVFTQFTIQRPRDPRVPEGLLSIGRLYQSIGQLDKAIPVYQRNIRENPKTPASYTSAVNLARAYMTLAESLPAAETPATAPATGPATSPAASAPAATVPAAVASAPASEPDLRHLTRQQAYDKAEAALLSLVQQNTDLLPTANEFRISLFTLGELYYRAGNRWADAILRLEEVVQRYPQDKGIPRALFYLAESYRKSAQEIAAALATGPPPLTNSGENGRPDHAALESARMERLLLAANDFSRVINALDPDAGSVAATDPDAAPKLSPLEMEILRTSYMDRAACYFDRGGSDLATAIKCYDETATRFSEETLAVRAYVQIVNAYIAMNQPAQAAAAAERGRWILQRIPEAAFDQGPAPMPRAAYERLLTLGRP